MSGSRRIIAMLAIITMMVTTARPVYAAPAEAAGAGPAVTGPETADAAVPEEEPAVTPESTEEEKPEGTGAAAGEEPAALVETGSEISAEPAGGDTEEDQDPAAGENADVFVRRGLIELLGTPEPETHVHCFCCGDTSCGDVHDASVEWTAWESTTALPTEVNTDEGKKYYYLTEDITLNNNCTADDGLFLCLNGHTVTMNNYRYECDGTLTITNCAEADAETGARDGGFVQGASSYVNDYMIKARNLNLYHVSLTSTDVEDGYYLVGHDATSGDDLPDYYIEDCVFTVGSRYRGSSAAIMLRAANDVTVKNSKITGSSEFIETNGLKVTDIRGRLVLSDTDILLNTEISYSGSYFGTFTYALTVTSSEDAGEHQISNCTIGITDTYAGNSVDICAVNLTGPGEYALTDCTISASVTGTGKCTGLNVGDGSTAILDGCTVTATNVTENGNGTVYAVYKEGSLSLLNGSEVTATTGRSSNAYGIFSKSSGNAHTLDVVDSNVTGREYGIYLNTTNQAGAQTLNIKNAAITATRVTPYIEADAVKGVGIYHYPSWNDYDTIYLGGETDVTGSAFSINVGRPSSSSSAVDHFMPTIYAKSKDGTVLSAEGEAIDLYCDYRRNDILTGDRIILDGMSALLADKIKLIYPDTCYLGTDGKAVKKTLYHIEMPGSGNFAGCEEYAVYVDEACKTAVWNKYNNSRVPAGVKLYLKAVAKTHYVFDKWKIIHRVNNNNVEYGEGELLDQALTVNENSFSMPENAIEVRPSFREAPSHLITYKGGAESDGTVADFTGKKYDGEDTALATKVFKNKSNKTQTGWSLTDGGELAYALGAVCSDDTITELYPYWLANHTITLKYGNLVPEGHTAGEVAATITKYPGKTYSFGWEDEGRFGFELGGTGASTYYYAVDDEGCYWELDGLSTSAAGTTQDYVFYTGSSEKTNLYTADEDITLYPYWVRLYRVSFLPGTYGEEREEPLPDLFKLTGRSVTLPGSINSDNVKTVLYESTREDYSQGGWSVNEDGSTKDYALAGSYSANADVTLYPYWEPIYSITYLPGEHGQSMNGAEQYVVKKYAGVRYNIYYSKFMRPGYTQTGWNTAEDGTGTPYAFNSSYAGDADLTLYPVWQANHTITYMPDAHTPDAAPVRDTKYYGAASRIRDCSFRAEGYSFTGWTVTEGGDHVDHEAGDEYTTEADLVLYPVWRPVTYALWIGNTQVNTDNAADVLGDGTVSYDPAASTLTLNGCEIEEYRELAGDEMSIRAGILALGGSDNADRGITSLQVVLTGENLIAPAFPASGTIQSCGIFTEYAPLLITGDGKLTIGQDDDGNHMTAAIYAGAAQGSAPAFEQRSGELDLFAERCGIMTDTFRADGILVSGGTLNAKVTVANAAALYANTLYATGVRITGGTVSLTTTANAAEVNGEELVPVGIYTVTEEGNGVVITGGTLTITNTGDGGYGISAMEIFWEQEVELEPVYGMKLLSGTVTIAGKTVSYYTDYRNPLILGEGTVVQAGADADSATRVEDYLTKYTDYPYAVFSGGMKPAETYLHIGDTAVTDTALFGEGWVYAPATRTLTLTDLDLDTCYEYFDSLYGIYAYGDLTVVLCGASSIGMNGTAPDFAICTEGDLTFTGSGYLNADSTYMTLSAANITFENGTIDVGSEYMAVNANDSMFVHGGVLNAETAEQYAYPLNIEYGSLIQDGGEIVVHGLTHGVYAGEEFILRDGSFTVEATGGEEPEDEGTVYAIRADDVLVEGGSLQAKAYLKAVECETYEQNGGEVSLISSCTEQENAHSNGAAIYAEQSVTVSGGSLYTEAEYTCIEPRYKGKTLTVNGGLVRAIPRANKMYMVGTAGYATPTISFGNVIINGGRLEAKGNNYCLWGYATSSTTSRYPSVKMYGGSILLDDSQTEASGYNRLAINGSINVYVPSSRFRTAADSDYTIRTGGSYALNCISSSYDYLEISAVQTVAYRPGEHGTGDAVNAVKDAGVALALADALYTREGYIQTGWSVNEGADKTYDLGELYDQEADLLLYPFWSEERSIIYKPGTAAETAEYTDRAADGNKAVLRGLTYTKEGAVQTGWNTAQDGTGEAYGLEQEITVGENLTLYPAWTENAEIRYILTILKGARGRGEEPAPASLGIGQTYTLPGAIFTRGGYAQTGWSLTDGGDKAYGLTDRIVLTQDTALYPFWNKEYRLTYLAGRSPGRGTVEPLYQDAERYSPVIETGEEQIIDSALFAYVPAEGEKPMVQIGWTLTNGSNTVDHEFGDTVTLDDSCTMYPVWQTDGLRVIFEGAAQVPVSGTNDEVIWVVEYTGAAIKPAVRVYDGGTLLTERKDYTLVWRNNIKAEMTAATLAGAGKHVTDEDAGLTAAQKRLIPCLTVTGMGNYADKEEIYFSIQPVRIDRATAANRFEASGEFTYAYVKRGNTVTMNKPVPTVSGTLAGKAKRLTNNTEFKVSYYKAYLYNGNWQLQDGLLRTTGDALAGIGETGKYVIRIDGYGNFSGTLTMKAEVTEKTLISKARITGFKATVKLPYLWNGTSAMTQPDLKLMDGTTTLVQGTHYTVSYSGNVGVGTATMTITGKGNYAGSKTQTYKITGYNLSTARQEGFKTAVDYAGNAIRQTGLKLYFMDGKTRRDLVEGTHYTAAYTNNLLPGTATVVYTGLRAYAGTTLKKTYKINGIPVTKLKINNFKTGLAYDYDGTAHTLPVRPNGAADGDGVYVTYQEKAGAAVQPVAILTKEQFDAHENGVYIRYITDPAVRGNNTTVGTASVEFVGSGIYTGITKKTFTIRAYDLKTDPQGRITVEFEQEPGCGQDEFHYTKGAVTPVTHVYFTDADDHVRELDNKSVRIGYRNNTKVSTGATPNQQPTVTVNGLGNFKGARAQETFTIIHGVLSAVTVDAPDKVYANRADNYTATLKVTDTNGKLLTAGVDYERAVVYRFVDPIPADPGVKNKKEVTGRDAGSVVQKGDIVPALEGGTRIEVILRGKGNYAADSETSQVYSIRQFDLSRARCTFTPGKKYYYFRGNPVRPVKADLTLTVGTGKNAVVVPTDQYEIDAASFTGDTKKGNAAFMVRGVANGNYCGSLKITYPILARSVR